MKFGQVSDSSASANSYGSQFKLKRQKEDHTNDNNLFRSDCPTCTVRFESSTKQSSVRAVVEMSSSLDM